MLYKNALMLKSIKYKIESKQTAKLQKQFVQVNIE